MAARCPPPQVAIVDYQLGNLYSVQHACRHVGLEARITSQRESILAADAVILPGVGAFGDAMACLRRLDLVGPLREAAAGGKPLLGVCLGLQLLMSESEEFGRHRGLDILAGRVRRFDQPRGPRGVLKVPHVGWERVCRPAGADTLWQGTVLEGQRDGECMYFVHSYYVEPDDPAAALCESHYGDVRFCSAVRRDNVVAFQFHPEKSGPQGLRIYDAFRRQLLDRVAARRQAG